MFPALPLSRTFGDLIGHSIGVTSEPDVYVHKLLQNDKCLMISTKSLWDHVDPKEVGEIITDYENKEYGLCTQAIYEFARDRAISDGKKFDDFSIIISQLNYF